MNVPGEVSSVKNHVREGRMTAVGEILLAGEPAIRLGVFLGVFTVMALWESVAPRQERSRGRRLRWPGNLGIVVVDTVVLRVLFPTAAVGMALLAEQRG